jgi:hypothetical protein
MQGPSFPDEKTPSNRRNFALRAMILGAIYMLAIAFAVAFSPSMGIAPVRGPAQIDNVAATPGSIPR